MKAIIEYSAIKEVEKKKFEFVEPRTTSLSLQISAFIFLIIFCFIPNVGAVPFGISLSILIFFIKYVIDKQRKLQFSFLPQPDYNYVDIIYKTKVQAIDAKITCHPECNPVRIMQNESNRLYVLSNSSNSLFTI